MLRALENGVRGSKWYSLIDKPGSVEKRPLGIPAVRDRIVQGAIRNVMEPIFERSFAEHSYGFRPGRGCKDALRRVQELLRSGHHWVVDLDLKSYFDTIPHDRLLERVQEQVADGRLIQLLESYLKAGVMEGLRGWEPTEQGTPPGAVIKTRIVDATQRGGFDFLGYHFERGLRWPRKRSLDKWIRMRLRSLLRKRHKGRGHGYGRDHVRWPNAYFERHGLYSLLRARASIAQSQ